jgi:hypothetical protein
VVATILLLALTVTLFAAIFAFVTTFPAPQVQSSTQFQASEVLAANQTYVTAIKILHLAGPSVPGAGLVYLKSAMNPSAPEFQSPYTVSSGLSGAAVWNLGQTWNLGFSSPNLPSAHDNISIYIVNAGSLLFSVILPGSALLAPPTVVSTSISPAGPAVGAPFTVFATLAGSYTTNSVYVNLAAVPGGPTTPQKMTQNAQGQWTYAFTTGATSSGTFYGFVNASSSSGQKAVAVVVITISSGGTTNGPLSVGVVLVPSPPNSGTVESVVAVVTYTGPTLGSPAALNVTFSASSTPSGFTYAGYGPSGVTISGPGAAASVTVTSQTTWTLPNPASLTLYTFQVTAMATVAGVGTNNGTTTFTPATVTVGPSAGLMGSTATARGAGFVPSTSVTLSLGGVVITPSGSSNATCTFSGSTITTTSTGTFACRFVVPSGAPAGTPSLLARDTTTGQNDSATFALTAWTVTVGPSTGLIGNIVTARGAGFLASSSVTLTFNGITITPFGSTNGTCTFSGSTITTTAAGAFACRFVVPSGTAPGVANVVATDSGSGQVATTTAFSVTAWSITLSTPSYAHGTAKNETITGVGFDASSFVSILFNGVVVTPTGCQAAQGTVAGNTITTTATGGFTCYYIIASTVGAGVYPVTAIDATSAQTATAYVRLT